MEMRKLGGLVVSSLGLGTSTWGSTNDVEDAVQQTHAYLDAGGNLLDSADVYGGGLAEETVGHLWDNGIRRDDVVLATKAAGVVGTTPPFPSDASRAHLLSALDASLRRLRTDHVDLWQLHTWDYTTPMDETLSALETAIASGKVRFAGICNYMGWQTARAACGSVPLVSAQVEYSLVERGIEREVVPAAQEFGLGLLPWGPLGRGVLTGKYRDGVPPERERSRLFQWYTGFHLRNDRTAAIVDAAVAAATELGTSPGAVALAWVRDRPLVVAPLVGARSADQLRESLLSTDLLLPQEIRHELDELSVPYKGYPETGT